MIDNLKEAMVSEGRIVITDTYSEDFENGFVNVWVRLFSLSDSWDVQGMKFRIEARADAQSVIDNFSQNSMFSDRGCSFNEDCTDCWILDNGDAACYHWDRLSIDRFESHLAMHPVGRLLTGGKEPDREMWIDNDDMYWRRTFHIKEILDDCLTLIQAPKTLEQLL